MSYHAWKNNVRWCDQIFTKSVNHERSVKVIWCKCHVDCLQKYLQLPKPAGANDQKSPPPSPRLGFGSYSWEIYQIMQTSHYVWTAFLGGGKGGEITVKWMFPCISIFGCPLHRCYFKMTPYLNKHWGAVVVVW